MDSTELLCNDKCTELEKRLSLNRKANRFKSKVFILSWIYHNTWDTEMLFTFVTCRESLLLTEISKIKRKYGIVEDLHYKAT